MIGAIWSRIRNQLYDSGVSNIVRSESKVISIGNLTWGGTGKTALAASIGHFLIQNGLKVAIISRGYGRNTRGMLVVKPDDTSKSCGDEPLWLAKKLGNAVVIVSESRAEAVDYLRAKQIDVIILDDAFQHRKVFRDLDLVLVDGSEDITALRVLPFGKLREPLGSIRRASAVIVNHSSRIHPNTSSWLSKNVETPIFHADYRPLTSEFSEKNVGMFCGIAAPHHFAGLLLANGAKLVFQRNFRDHHDYLSHELEAVQKEAEKSGAEMLITTEKDFVRIENFKFRLPVLPVSVEFDIHEKEEFFRFLLSNIQAPRNEEIASK